jgi:ferritin-like metal-binding protein YciE
MEGKRMQLASLQELFTNELKDLYDAEKQILKELPKMVDAASSPKLQKGFQQHLEQTRKHVERLDQIFQNRQVAASRKKCKGVEGILEEGGELLKQDVDPDVLDAGLIAAAQKVEHYEIASYGSVRTYAELLGTTKPLRYSSRLCRKRRPPTPNSPSWPGMRSIWRQPTQARGMTT